MPNATTWALGTSSPLQTTHHLPNVVSVTPEYRMVGVQYRTWDAGLVEDRVGLVKSWQVRCEALTSAQRATLVTLFRTTTAIYFRDDAEGVDNILVRFVSALPVPPNQAIGTYMFDVEFTIESVGTV